MPNDIRAISTCSLGVIVGGAEINDDYINGGNGLVKTTGSVTIDGLITPAVGTPVTFNYTKSGITRQIPRALRVLSSYADPTTRQTSVELGCKLTYLDDLRERINWKALDDPSNTLTADDAKIITIPIFAQGIALKCLTELDLTSSSFQLSNAFSIAKFDLSPGYVKVLADLLVSENLVGYLDMSEVLQVVSLQQEGGTGPVFELGSLISTSKIGSGTLPAESVIARYSTLKLKQPKQTQPLGWQEQLNSVFYKIEIPYFHIASEEGRIATYNILESTHVASEYQDVIVSPEKTLRLLVRRVTTFTSEAAAHAGNVFSEYLANGISINNSSVQKITTETFEYDENGNEKLYNRSVSGGFVFVLGSISVPIVFESGYVLFNFDNKIQLERETRQTTTSNNVQQVATWSYAPWFTTIAGQQSISTGRDGFESPSAVVNYVNNITNAGLSLKDYRVETISASKPVGVPTLAEINNAENANGGDPNNGYQTMSESKVILAMGSATAQRRAEFTPPYVPDDRFSKSFGGQYFSIPSDAENKALNYAKTQNRLNHANRNGMNIQILPELLPDAPFAPFVIRSGGVSALYRTNGRSWTISEAGVIASTDALFWGGVGGSGPRWFPVAPGITTLPTAPPVVDGQMTVGQVVPVATETSEPILNTRMVFEAQEFDYLLSETITQPPIILRALFTASEIIPPVVNTITRLGFTVAEIIPELATMTMRTNFSATEILPEVVNMNTKLVFIATANNPIPNLSPLFFYDFSNMSTVTTSGSEITGISDQGSLGWNLTKSGTGPTLAEWSDKNCANWGTPGHNNSLRYSHSGSPVTLAQVFIVLDANFGSTFPDYNGLLSSRIDDSVDFSISGNPTSLGFDTGGPNWFDFATINGGSTNKINAVLPTINSRCVLMLRRASGDNPVLDDGLQIGNDRSSSGRGWGGLVGLVVGFSTVLNPDDTANVINYLMTDWTIT